MSNPGTSCCSLPTLTAMGRKVGIASPPRGNKASAKGLTRAALAAAVNHVYIARWLLDLSETLIAMRFNEQYALPTTRNWDAQAGKGRV